jgi:hypothetical protein
MLHAHGASMDIFASAQRYENWLRKQLDDVVEKHLAAKHGKMAENPFVFLRATYWRFAETVYDVCGEQDIDLSGGPSALSVGDIHVENFGTWRDADGRLIWGVNDFDEAAEMPYMLDIVRLAASAVLAGVKGVTQKSILQAIADGYQAGLDAPDAFVLDREHKHLRDIVIVDNDERKKFWKKFDPKKIAEDQPPKVDPLAKAPPRYRQPIEAEFPDGTADPKYYSREAGSGSLGRARIFGVGEWQGDLVVREAKAMVASGWALAHGGTKRLRCVEIATGPYRSPDPTYRLSGDVLVRRLSPNDFKIEVKQAKEDTVKELKSSELINHDMLVAMGHELASIHAGTGDAKAIAKDFRKRQGGDLRGAVKAVCSEIEREQEKWKDHPDKWPRTKG